MSYKNVDDLSFSDDETDSTNVEEPINKRKWVCSESSDNDSVNESDLPDFSKDEDSESPVPTGPVPSAKDLFNNIDNFDQKTVSYLSSNTQEFKVGVFCKIPDSNVNKGSDVNGDKHVTEHPPRRKATSAPEYASDQTKVPKENAKVLVII
mgnify:CR=1 FL=1